MSYFSAFWKKHYNDIGFCCTMQPLQESAFAYKNMIRHVVEFMDTQWMINKQLKWIGWDKWDYYAWVAPDGMLYRFDDLPRNEAGKIYEKEERKLQLNPDMPPYPVASQLDFYEWELSVLLDCGFCHDRKSGEVPDGDEKERQGGTGTNVAVPGWEQYASGNVTNTNYATNTGDTTYTGDTAYTNNAATNYAPPTQQGGQGGSEGRERDYIPRLPYAPPAQLPGQPATQQPATWQPPTQQPPATRPRTPKQNPVLNTKKVVDNPVVDDPVVTYTPYKNPSKGYEPTYNPAPIDNLRVKPIVKRKDDDALPIKPAHLENYDEFLERNLKEHFVPKTKINSNVKIPKTISFGSNAKESAVSQKTVDILEKIMAESGNPSITITSTQRTPEDQARAMLDNIVNRGVKYNLELYGASGDKVVRFAEQALKQKQPLNNIREGMAKLIRQIGPEKVSKHVADPKKINVIDIAPSSLKNPKALINAALNRRYTVLHPYSYPSDPAIHIEIPQ